MTNKTLDVLGELQLALIAARPWMGSVPRTASDSENCAAAFRVVDAALLAAARIREAQGGERGEESGWVIELGESDVSRPTYWMGVGVGTPFEWPFGSWTDDNLKAVRFCRKDDAQRVADSIYHFSGENERAKCRVAEHGWS